MKTFKDYLTESKRTYAFRIKIADYELDGDTLDRIEQGLSAFQLADITKPKSLPISRCQEFHKLGPIGRQVFDAETNYPANPPQIQQAICSATGFPQSHVYVTTPGHDGVEETIETDSEKEALLNTPEMSDADGDAQNHVGLKRVESLLKELGKEKRQEQVKGTNDSILAKTVPTEKAAKTSDQAPQNNKSVLKPNTTPRGK